MREELLLYLPFLLNAVDSAQMALWKPFSERKHFVSIGNFLHEPNWDAVLYLKNEIWPKIREELPDAELHVYGAYPSQKVFDLHKPKEGFVIKGRAHNALEVIGSARICLAPLRFGAGLKGKLTDAMQCGTPSITTRIGAEGMHNDLAWNGVVTDNPEDFCKSAIHLYSSEQDWYSMQKNGIAIINQVYDKKKYSEILVQKIMAIADNLEKHRLNNFTGNMLHYHTMTSTKYMAKWIEEKNKMTKP